MAPIGVVPAFDELEYGHAVLRLGGKRAPIEQLAFQRGEEALAHRVVVGIPDRAHGRPHIGLLAAQSQGDRGVLRALVAMVDDIGRPALGQRTG